MYTRCSLPASASKPQQIEIIETQVSVRAPLHQHSLPIHPATNIHARRKYKKGSSNSLLQAAPGAVHAPRCCHGAGYKPLDWLHTPRLVLLNPRFTGAHANITILLQQHGRHSVHCRHRRAAGEQPC